MLEKEVVMKYKWATEEELMNYFAISQSTPGIIAINTATFIGMKFRGMMGAIVATVGVVTPSWIIISLIANILGLVKDNLYVSQAFMGVRIVVVALIIHSVINMGKKAVKSPLDMVLFVSAFLLVGLNILTPIYVISMGIMIGVIGLSIKGVRQNGSV
jgi:chromate transporter